MTYSLYILKHPDTEEPIYVGVTSNIKKRLSGHSPKYFKKFGFRPTIDALMTFSDHKMATAVEKATIKSLREIHTLSNKTRYSPGLRAKVETKTMAASISSDTINEINEIRKADKRSFSLMVALLLSEALRARKQKHSKKQTA